MNYVNLYDLPYIIITTEILSFIYSVQWEFISIFKVMVKVQNKCFMLVGPLSKAYSNIAMQGCI